jgi:hypothetical protein
MNQFRLPKSSNEPMKALMIVLITLAFLTTIGCRPGSTGVKSGRVHDNAHMNRLSHTLVIADSGTDGAGKPSSDRGVNRFFS